MHQLFSISSTQQLPKSRQKININKSNNYFSSNVSAEDRNNLSTLMNIRQTNKIGKYLGFPITNLHPRSLYYQYIIDNMNNKLNAWRDRFLAPAGRTTLIKSVLSTIPPIPCNVISFPNQFVTIQIESKEILSGNHT